tara:strand:+ start:470 stop:718 length:249 start_codon:yes stop_codon:yes gene_type:complete
MECSANCAWVLASLKGSNNYNSCFVGSKACLHHGGLQFLPIMFVVYCPLNYFGYLNTMYEVVSSHHPNPSEVSGNCAKGQSW